jgi:hypothetical protein
MCVLRPVDEEMMFQTLSVGSNNSAHLSPGRRKAVLVQKPNVPCHVHKILSLTGLCLFKKKERSHARYE